LRPWQGTVSAIVAFVYFICQGVKSDVRFEALVLTNCCDIVVIIPSCFGGGMAVLAEVYYGFLSIEAHPGIIL
jgi:arginine exporter protein ArgO